MENNPVRSHHAPQERSSVSLCWDNESGERFCFTSEDSHCSWQHCRYFQLLPLLACRQKSSYRLRHDSNCWQPMFFPVVIVPIKWLVYVGSCCGALFNSAFLSVTILLRWGYFFLPGFMSRHGNCSWMSISCWQVLRAPDLWYTVVQIRPQGGWMALMTVNIMRWRHVLVCGWNPRLTTVPRTVRGSAVWCGCAWPLNDPVCLFWGAARSEEKGIWAGTRNGD